MLDFIIMIKNLLVLKQKLVQGVNVYVIIFGPTVNSICHCYRINREKANELLLQVKSNLEPSSTMKAVAELEDEDQYDDSWDMWCDDLLLKNETVCKNDVPNRLT